MTDPKDLNICKWCGQPILDEDGLTGIIEKQRSMNFSKYAPRVVLPFMLKPEVNRLGICLGEAEFFNGELVSIKAPCNMDPEWKERDID